ncbi:2-C-methyl-D-erythritol 2,4-cyclodiphosphate synthase [Bacteroidota bacterium]
MDFRIGFGYDVHQLVENHQLWLGGILIPAEKGCIAHSDGDVLIHAICDALLGSLSLGDLGHQFPDTSEDFKNIDSKILLKRTCVLVKDRSYSIVNVDSTICLQKPKISSYINDMKKIISNILEINKEMISIKATTTERMGFVGEEKGISAYAVVMVKAV